MKRRHWLWIGIAVALAIGAFAWTFRPQPVRVEVAEVRQELFAQTVEEDGKTRVRERYAVSAPPAGQLARVMLKPGGEVKAGTVVALLAPAAPAMIDARTPIEAWIEEGLAPGERVIVYPSDSVAGGKRVAIARGPR